MEGFSTPESTKAERVRANGLINKRLKLGLITRPKCCSKCGKPGRVDSHHPDYSKPSQIVWLCRRHHMLSHRDPSSIADVPVIETGPVHSLPRRVSPTLRRAGVAAETGVADAR